MHALSSAQDILKTALTEAEKHAARQVRAFNIRIGGAHSEEADSLQFCLEAIAIGTIADGARIDVEVVRTAICRECSLVFQAGDSLSCPRCRSESLQPIAYDDSLQVTLEVE